MVMLFPEQHTLQLCSDTAFWNTWEKISMAAITLKRKLGSPLLASPHSFLIPQPHVLPPVCTPTALSKWRHRIKSWSAGTMKCMARQEQVHTRNKQAWGLWAGKAAALSSDTLCGRAHRLQPSLKGSLNTSVWRQTISLSSLPKPQPPSYTQIVFPFKSLFAKVNQSILHLVSDQSFQHILYFLWDVA